MEFTLAQFQVATGADETHATLYYPHAVEACARFKIDETPARLAAFFGTISVESRQLSMMEEDLYYRDAARLVAIFPSKFKSVDEARPYCRMPADLSRKLYNGYHGRGAGQLTWEKNYKVHGDRLGYDYVGNPAMVKTPPHAILSFASFWDLNDINDVADDMTAVTRRVNGPKLMHLAERIARCNTALNQFT